MSVILLATTIAAMPFLYQLIAGSYADANYQEQLAEWNENQERFHISEETVAELKKRQEGLRVMTRKADRSGDESSEDIAPEESPTESETPAETEE